MSYYGNYPSNSGPPPAPLGGAYNGYGGGGAYGGGGGYRGGNPYDGGGYGGYPGGGQPSAYNANPYGSVGYTYPNPAAVPGFTAPHPPQGMQPPMSRQFQYANQSMQPYGCQMQNMTHALAMQNPNDPLVQQLGQMGQELAQAQGQARQQNMMSQCHQYQVPPVVYQMQQTQDDQKDAQMRELEQKYAQLQEKAQKQATEKMESDGNFKETMRQTFVNELMRRQDVSGTFEDISGIVNTCQTFGENDHVALWFSKNKYAIAGTPYEPQPDVEFFKEGFRGIGTNEDMLIELASNRSNAQRNRLLLDYKTAYGKDLIEEIQGETSGNFRSLLIGLFETPARYDAYCIKKAIYGLGTDEATIIEIMMTRTNAQLKEMLNEYNSITYEKMDQRGKNSLEKDIEDDTSGDFKRLLISATTANRRTIQRPQLENAVEEDTVAGRFTGMFKVDYKKLANMTKCEHEAKALYKAGEDKWGTDEETFNRIFSVEDYFTLRQIYDEYVKLSQRDIINSINRETSGDYEKGLLAIAESVKCRPMFFAKKLYQAMKGLGTDDQTLIRIIISRAEIDLVQIKQCFLNTYNQTLWNFIQHDTSGDYRKLLQAVVGKN